MGKHEFGFVHCKPGNFRLAYLQYILTLLFDKNFQLLVGQSYDENLAGLLSNLTWYITPVLNPDGYEFTRSSTDPTVSQLL